MEESILKLPFPEAIKFMRKKIPLPSTSWRQYSGEVNQIVFSIAGITKASLLADIQNLIVKQLETGITVEGFKKNFDTLIDKSGWNPANRGYRTELILQQNLKNAHARGRWEQMRSPAVAKARPYWQFIHRDSRVPRPKHKALDLSVFPANSEIFKAIMPPPWGCKCSVHTLSERDLEREGLKVSKPPDLDTIREPGFGYGFSELPKERERLLKDAKARLPKAFADLI